jgi:hypothetical protein
MPTENRSSNTEMVSVPRELANRIQRRLDLAASAFKAAKPERDQFRALLAQPAPQPHPEPIAWMVGTAIWWTKEEAERDAAEVGQPVVGLGPMRAQQAEPVWFMTEGGVSALHAKAKAMSDQQGLDTSSYSVPLYTYADTGEVERLRAELKNCTQAFHALKAGNESLRAQLAERDALLREWRHGHHHTLKSCASIILRTDSVLSASAEPALTCHPCKIEQPTDRPCDVCGRETELTGTAL